MEEEIKKIGTKPGTIEDIREIAKILLKDAIKTNAELEATRRVVTWLFLLVGVELIVIFFLIGGLIGN